MPAPLDHPDAGGMPSAASRGEVLVVSSVHLPDDPRIRYKLVETLRASLPVRLAVRAPGPTDAEGFDVQILRGSRIMRTLRASALILRGHYSVASVHDPELLPAAIVAGGLGRTVVFDLHEDVPAQLSHKSWVPRRLVRPLQVLARRLLLLAERVVTVSLAEPNYAHLFAHEHPVFPNYLPEAIPPVPLSPGSGVVYLGDISETRGAVTAVRAAAAAGVGHLTLIGRCGDELAGRLERLADELGLDLRMPGFTPIVEALRLASGHAVAISPLHDVPNYRWSLPTKLLEYLAVGLPVVASDLPGGHDVLGSADGIVWVAPGDEDALAAAMATVVHDRSLAEAARAGAAQVRANYRWPGDEVRAFYSDLR